MHWAGNSRCSSRSLLDKLCNSNTHNNVSKLLHILQFLVTYRPLQYICYKLKSADMLPPLITNANGIFFHDWLRQISSNSQKNPPLCMMSFISLCHTLSVCDGKKFKSIECIITSAVLYIPIYSICPLLERKQFSPPGFGWESPPSPVNCLLPLKGMRGADVIGHYGNLTSPVYCISC